jgi:hypothetical protein
MGIAAVMMGGMGTIMAGTLAMQGYQMANKPKMPDIKFPDLPNQNTNDNEAQKAADKRRQLYAGMGRSSTILTGPGGVSGSSAATAGDPSMPKVLLGL